MSPLFDDPKALRAALQEPYGRKAWIDRLLPGLFPSLQIGANPTRIEVPSNEWEQSFDSAFWIGSARLKDDQGRERRIWLAELTLKEPDRLKARVTLRRGLSKLLGAGEVEAVLAFFVSAHGEYRATFAAAEWDWVDGRVVKRETPPKRFSFALGPGEQVKTAAQRFKWLHDRRDASLFSNVAEAFSVEKLTKAFFEGYRERFRRLSAELAAPGTAKQFGLAGTTDAIEANTKPEYKTVRDFAKRMMGRVVFLKFVQRKGWLGADPSAPPGVFKGGDPQFLRRVIEDAPSRNPYSGPLVTLFFETLNTRRADDLCPLTQRRVPYLNSGLFEPEPLNVTSRKTVLDQHKALNVPAEPLREFFAFLDEFNFTVDENSPDDSEVGVDPEMLGHIFENLLEDNKEKGAFYTPKGVVGFMCQESLLAYLERRFGARQELKRLVRLHDVGDWNSEQNWVKAHAAEIYEALEGVQVCDPACGSGAFPMGMLNEIFWIRYSLRPVKQSQLSDLRKSIIQNNLHGVDIDANAVEIARLRFWLSIVVDAVVPEPLPNLDFRFLQGNSLVGFVGAESEWAKRFLLGDEGGDQQFELALADSVAVERVEKFGTARKHIADLIQTHFRTSGPGKDALAVEVLTAERRFVLDVLKHLKSDLTKLKSTAKNETRVASLDARIRRLQKEPLTADRDYFPWVFYEDRGFDIVIANPPYISAIDHKKSAGEEARTALKEAYVTAAGAFDIYVCFFELAANLLVDGGALTFITPNKWLSVSYAEQLREFFAERMDLRSITDLSSVGVFKSVSVYPVVTCLRKGVDSRLGYVEVSVGEDAGDGDVRFSDLPPAAEILLDALPGRIWGFLLDSRRLLLSRLLERSVWLKDVAEVNALTTAGEADELGKSLADDKKASLKVVNTGTIDPFTSLWGERPLVKQGRKFLHPTFKGKTTALQSRQKLFETPKIIVAKMALSCEAFWDRDGEFAGIDVNAIYSPAPPYSLQFLIGYIHSSCAAFCHLLFFKGLAMAGGYLPFQAPHLRVLPVPDLRRPEGQQLRVLVEKAAARLTKGKFDQVAMEEIDAAVMAFYGFSPEDAAQIANAAQERAEPLEVV